MTRPVLLAIALLFGTGACNSGGSGPAGDAGNSDAGHDASNVVRCECACSPAHVRFDKPEGPDCWEISCEPYCGAPGFGNACAVP